MRSISAGCESPHANGARGIEGDLLAALEPAGGAQRLAADDEHVRPVPRAGEVGAAVAVHDGERRERATSGGQHRGGHARLHGRAANPAAGARDAGGHQRADGQGDQDGQRVDEEPRHVGREEGHRVQERRDDGQGRDVERHRRAAARGRAQRPSTASGASPASSIDRPPFGQRRGTGAARG